MTFLIQDRSVAIFFLALLSVTLSSCQLPSAFPNPNQTLSEWVRTNAVPLKSMEPGTDGDDLRAFGDMIGDARLVALGEPTHGNREVFQLKHRMFEYLVREKGFRLFALEAPFAESEDMNAYVLYGHGSAEEALSGLTMWVYDTEEVVALLDWMRAYNADPKNTEKLKVYGFDVQNPERATRLTLKFLERVDPEFAKLARNQIGGLATPYSDPDELGWRPIRATEASDADLAMASAVLAQFDNYKAEYISASSYADWARQMHYAQQVHLWIGMNHNDGANYGQLRENGMLYNVERMMEINGPQSKGVLWAHNVHVADMQSPHSNNVEMAGRLWRRAFGTDLRIVGFRFNHGEFTALRAVAGGELETFKIDPAEPGLIEAELAKAGEVDLLLDLQAFPSDGPVAEYFNQPQKTRFSGGGYDHARSDRYYITYDLPEAFDIIAYVHETTATRHVDRTNYADIRPETDPANLSFETGFPDLVPPSWVAWSKTKRWGYSSSIDQSTAYAGEQSGRLCREADHMSPDVSGSLLQYIDPTPFKGGAIRFRSHAKISGDQGDVVRAFVRLKISPSELDSAHDTVGVIYDSRDAQMVEATDWEEYEIEAPVPDAAGSIMFGVFLTGEGCVWLDDVELIIN